MKRLDRSRMLVAEAALTAIIFLLGASFIYGQPPTGQPSPVPNPINARIVNTAAEPVPVVGTVNVGNLGDNPLPVTGTVTVGNLGTTTLIVRDADASARIPFHQEFNLSMSSGEGGGNETISIPAGKMLVVEHVSGNASLDPGHRMTALYIRTPSPIAGRFYYHYFVWVHEGTIANASSPARMYATGQLTMAAARNTSQGAAGVGGSISGYLINLPPSN